MKDSPLSPEHSRALRAAVDSNADDARLAYIERWQDQFKILSERCESPIERLLGAYLLMISDGYRPVEFFEKWEWAEGTTDTYFACQVPVGQYRCDFVFKASFQGDERLLVVECDGHDFHERTKEQARRDRQRDRWMSAKGAAVMRFTGSEIHADPEKCAGEVSLRLTDIVDELFAAHGLGERRKRGPIA